eukprot:gene14712-biopygen9621
MGNSPWLPSNLAALGEALSNVAARYEGEGPDDPWAVHVEGSREGFVKVRSTIVGSSATIHPTVGMARRLRGAGEEPCEEEAGEENAGSKELTAKLYPHLPRARGVAEDGGVLMGKKLLEVHKGLQECVQSQSYRAAKQDLAAWSRPRLLPKGLRKGIPLEQLIEEFQCAQFTTLCQAVTNR